MLVDKDSRKVENDYDTITNKLLVDCVNGVCEKTIGYIKSMMEFISIHLVRMEKNVLMKKRNLKN